MKFKLDENLPVSSAAILTGAGHDVDTVTEEGLSRCAGPEMSSPRPPQPDGS